MKANDGSGNNVERDEWRTPQKLFDELDNRKECDNLLHIMKILHIMKKMKVNDSVIFDNKGEVFKIIKIANEE